jgi:hypothetical protein
MNTVPFVLNYAHTRDTTIYSHFNDVMSHIPSTKKTKKNRTLYCVDTLLYEHHMIFVAVKRINSDTVYATTP